jgi:hypothetical protein
VAVKGPDADAGLPSDFFQAYRRSLFSERRARSFEQALTVTLGVGARFAGNG